ncbi:hypothetical protein D9V84_08395 [Bacteroidetes/Chlorobi group bacterium Naka2016]|jgi:hypothetical protein|nr:MAG: hypothetical protein D9V84_08395 [Bacteroidetes/Chlorobi group bacterium Naka2016]
MNRLKQKFFCLYLLKNKTLSEKVLKKFTIGLILSISAFITLAMPIFSQSSEFFYNIFNQNQNLNLYYFPYDSCIYFPENIFTTGIHQTGIKFAQPYLIKNQKKNNDKNIEQKIENDTTTKGNRIISIRETEKGDKIAIYLQVENMDQRIKIFVYNLLGKKVLDIYEGKPKDPSQPYEFSTNELPKGIFLLVVIGDNFRLREKLIITK